MSAGIIRRANGALDLCNFITSQVILIRNRATELEQLQEVCVQTGQLHKAKQNVQVAHYLGHICSHNMTKAGSL